MIKIKKTALNTIHHILRGKMIDFAGCEMLFQYTEMQMEHNEKKCWYFKTIVSSSGYRGYKVKKEERMTIFFISA